MYLLMDSFFLFLIGSDDIRAQDSPKSKTWRSEYSPVFKSIYDEPSTASERITGAGYRYLPVHRDTYGYSPRAIYAHHYNRPSEYKTNYYMCHIKPVHTHKRKSMATLFPPPPKPAKLKQFVHSSQRKYMHTLSKQHFHKITSFQLNHERYI